MQKKEQILLHRILYTLGILLIYMVGRKLPLYGVDASDFRSGIVDAQSILVQNITGDYKNCSVFVLGMWPYMWGSMISMVYVSIKSVDKASKVPQSRINRVILGTTMMVGIVQGLIKLGKFSFTKYFINQELTKAFVMLQMIAGMVIILWLCTRNQKYGIGGRTAIFLVNIVDSITMMVSGRDFDELMIPGLTGLVAIPLMLFLETSELHIFVQRVSIHNIHAEKNYIAYKLNPAGFMPLMFTSAVFMLPQMLAENFAKANPDNLMAQRVYRNMSLTSPVGVAVYLGLQTLLTLCFAFLMLSPLRTADNLMRGGDSILGVYAGKPTKRYLVKQVFLLATTSAVILGIIMGVPLFLQFTGTVDSRLAMMPCTIMMLTGVWLSISREAVVYKNLQDYRPMI